MTTTEVAVHKEATTRPVHEIAAELQAALGQRLVAYATGIRTPKLVGRWAQEDGPDPRDKAEARLRMLYRVYLVLRNDFGDATVRAFLIGSNPNLADETP